MLHPLFLSLLLGSVREATALALSGQERLPSTTARALDRRQGTVTRFSTIFSTGDASKPRSADSGFEARVDLLNGVWGFCATTDTDAADCGMPGSCFDSFSCSKGCGFTNAPLSTLTCSDSGAQFCSTAVLILASTALGPYTYLACGGGPRTDHYKAFTTTSAKPSSSEVATPGLIVPTPDPILPSTSTSTSTSKSKSPSASLTTTTVTTTSLPAGSTLNATTTLQVTTTTNSTAFPTSTANPEPASPNIAAIVGAIAGCLTLLGIIITIAIILRRRRNLKSVNPTTKLKKNPRPSSSLSSSSSTLAISAPLPVISSPKAELDAQVRALELPGRGAAAYDTSERHPAVGWGRCYPAMSPVELPGEWPAGGWGR